MAEKPNKVWTECLGWIIVNFVAVAAIGGLRYSPLTRIPGKLVSTLLIGLPISLAQWIALRRHAKISVLWIFTIQGGLILGLVSAPVLGGIFGYLDEESILLLTLISMSIGLYVGVFQWLLLRTRYRRSTIWPLASAMGLGLGVPIILGTNLIHQLGVASIILVTFIYAVTTGAVISWFSAADRRSERSLSEG